MKIEFYRHNLDENDLESVSGVLRSIFLTTGQKVSDFEGQLAAYVSAGHSVGVTSCTAALHLCLLAWDIKEGDEVITTPMSFCATSNAILHVNAKPVFVDVEEHTGNINAELIESKITEKTKAILPVHLYGQLCDMRRINQTAKKYNLAVIEDAAHCIEGVRDGFKVGQLGDAACYSFYATKNITSGEGGAISTNDPEKANLLKMLRSHGIDRSAADRYTRKYQHWDMPILGWKYNMDNIQAALLIGQLKRIDRLREQRERISSLYDEAFKGQKNIKCMKTVPDSRHSRHLYTVRVPADKRDYILHALQENEIGVAVNYRPIHLLKYYREKFGYREGDFPVAEHIGSETISLPLYPKLTDGEQERVISTLIKMLS